MSPPLFHVVALCLLKAVSSSKVSPGQQLDCHSGNLGFIFPLPQVACMSL